MIPSGGARHKDARFTNLMAYRILEDRELLPR